MDRSMHHTYPAPMSSPLNPISSAQSVSAGIAIHLRHQVNIVCSLYEQHQDKLSEQERGWIQNAVHYTKQVLRSYSAAEDLTGHDDQSHKRLQPFYTRTSKFRQPQSHATMWSSPFLIAMQDLNSAMTMLTWCTHNKAIRNETSSNNHSAVVDDSHVVELSNFLNRTRIGRRSKTNNNRVFREDMSLKTNVENTIAELRATNSLLRSTTRVKHANGQMSYQVLDELPLSLVDTIELWRQNAEDALENAMRRYFEQGAILRDVSEHEAFMDESTICDSESIVDSVGNADSGTIKQQPSNVIDHDVVPRPTHVEPSRNPSSPILRRKSVAKSPPSLGTPSISSISPNDTTEHSVLTPRTPISSPQPVLPFPRPNDEIRVSYPTEPPQSHPWTQPHPTPPPPIVPKDAQLYYDYSRRSTITQDEPKISKASLLSTKSAITSRSVNAHDINHKSTLPIQDALLDLSPQHPRNQSHPLHSNLSSLLPSTLPSPPVNDDITQPESLKVTKSSSPRFQAPWSPYTGSGQEAGSRKSRARLWLERQGGCDLDSDSG